MTNTVSCESFKSDLTQIIVGGRRCESFPPCNPTDDTQPTDCILTGRFRYQTNQDLGWGVNIQRNDVTLRFCNAYDRAV